jgi:hypothetical protein
MLRRLKLKRDGASGRRFPRQHKAHESFKAIAALLADVDETYANSLTSFAKKPVRQKVMGANAALSDRWQRRAAEGMAQGQVGLFIR